MFEQRILRSSLWFAHLWTVLIIGILGCGGSDGGGGSRRVFEADYEGYPNNWVGTWELTTVDGQSWARFLAEDDVNVSIHTNNWKFYDDGSLAVIVAFQFETEEDVIIPVVHEAGGTYLLTGSGYILEFKGIGTDFFKDSTGTWLRSQHVLKLTSRDGTIVRFTKK